MIFYSTKKRNRSALLRFYSFIYFASFVAGSNQSIE